MRLSINVEIIIILIIIFVIIFYSCAKPNTPYMLLEGFTNAAKNAGLKPIIKTKVTPNQNNKEAFSNKSYHNNSDDDEIILMFKDTPFKPECCPTTFSNSMGCSCMTNKQYEYLIHRGGNNVPYSQY